MKKLECQELDSLRVCDVLWKTGHVQMVFDVERKADTIYKVKLFEQSYRSAHIQTYSKENLRRMWNEYEYVAYRYEYLIYSNSPATYRGFETVTYNDDLCPSKGDRSVYRTDDTVDINIFNNHYSEIVLMKDGDVVSIDRLYGDRHQYHSLHPGLYEVYLKDGDDISSSVAFETIKADVKLSFINGGKGIEVHFNSSANADYVILDRRVGPPLYYPLSNQDHENGFIDISAWDVPEYYCKVVFRGEYGSIINRPIRVL